MPQFSDSSFRTEGVPRAADFETVYEAAFNIVMKQVTDQFKVDQIAMRTREVSEGARKIAEDQYEKMMTRDGIRFDLTRDAFIARVLSDILGMGAIETLLQDETIEDVAMNGPHEICKYSKGKWSFVPDLSYPSPLRLQEIINANIAVAQIKLNNTNPIVDADLPTEQRLSAVTYPVTGKLSTNWPVVVIRIPRARSISLLDMVQSGGEVPGKKADDLYSGSRDQLNGYMEQAKDVGLLTPELAAYLHMAVLCGYNIVVLGPTGVGKTTLLSALIRCLPVGIRILIIEDTPEIRIHPDSPVPLNVINLKTRVTASKELQEVNQQALVRLALRQRPDALLIGESRGGEVFDLLSAANTGHKNCITSFHAESVDRMFPRVYGMFAMSEMGRYYDQFRAAQLVASTLHIVIALEPTGGGRRVLQVAELTGAVAGNPPEPVMQLLFQRSGGRGSKLNGPLGPSVFHEKFAEAGFPSKIFSPS